MDALPQELKQHPKPVIAFLGLSDVTHCVFDSVAAINDQSGKVLCKFIKLSLQHQFPIKKEIRERTTSFSTRTEKSFDGVTPAGVMKSNWMQKHQELLPSVCVLVFELDVRLSATDWGIQETVITDEVERLKRAVSGRDCRILLVLLHSVEMEESTRLLDDRLHGLRRRTELDSKCVFVYKPKEVYENSALMNKLEASLRNSALEYYRVQAKRVKRYKKSLQKDVQLPFQVRHNFKIAYYYEFRGQVAKMLKYYYSAFNTTCTLLQVVNDKRSDITLTEVRTIAGFINYKICFHELLSSGNLSAAIEQFHIHMDIFNNKQLIQSYDHFDWVSQQYHIFAQLMEKSNKRLSSPNLQFDSKWYRDPYLYYSVATKYAVRRRTAAEKCKKATPVAQFCAIPSLFWGAEPEVTEASSSLNTYKPIEAWKYRLQVEKGVDHSGIVNQLLSTTVEHLSTSLHTGNQPSFRIRKMLSVRQGVEYVAEGKHEEARVELERAKTHYSSQRWWGIVAQLLRLLRDCSEKQNDCYSFLDYSLQLLSPRLNLSLSDLSEVQKSMMHKWDCAGGVGGPLFEYKLDRLRPLFLCSAEFCRISTCVNESVVVTVDLESYFPDKICFTSLRVAFNCSDYDVVICHRDGCDTLLREQDEYFLDLGFVYQNRVAFDLNLTIINGQRVVQCREIYFYKKKTPPMNDAQEQLVLKVEVTRADTIARRNSLVFSDGLPLTIRSHAAMFGGSDDSALQEGIDSSRKTLGTFIRVDPIQGNASIRVKDAPVLLVGDYRSVNFTIDSNTDNLCNPVVYFHCEIVKPKGVFYYKVDNGERRELDVNEGISLKDMAENTSQTCNIILHPTDPGQLHIRITLTYDTDLGAQVSVEMKFDFQCQTAYAANFSFFPEFPGFDMLGDISERDSVTQVAINRPISIQGVISNLSDEKLCINSAHFEKDENLDITVLQTSGELDDRSIVLQKSEQHSVQVRLKIVGPAERVCPGSVRIRWSRVEDGLEKLSNDHATTTIQLPHVHLVESTFSIDMDVPDIGCLGEPIFVNFCLTNHTRQVQPVKITVNKTTDFALEGVLSFTEYAQPRMHVRSGFMLYPMACGHLKLPQLEITTLRDGHSIVPAGCTREIFVTPRQIN